VDRPGRAKVRPHLPRARAREEEAEGRSVPARCPLVRRWHEVASEWCVMLLAATELNSDEIHRQLQHRQLLIDRGQLRCIDEIQTASCNKERIDYLKSVMQVSPF
jgi:hypothetical protein